jgi:hypothetical protein
MDPRVKPEGDDHPWATGAIKVNKGFKLKLSL